MDLNLRAYEKKSRKLYPLRHYSLLITKLMQPKIFTYVEKSKIVLFCAVKTGYIKKQEGPLKSGQSL